MNHSIRTLVALAALSFTAVSWGQNLLRNPGFEDIPGPIFGQGIMPSEWDSISADTYSNDGSYGLPPGANGNFTGVLAHSGFRFVAGANFGGGNDESIFQGLTANLTPGQSYTVSGWVHQAIRSDLNHFGAYTIQLWDSTHTSQITIGQWAPTTGNGEWEFRTLDFVAPSEATSNGLFVFRPYGVNDLAYPGLDDVSLTSAVPEPASMAILGLGLAWLGRRRRV